eukprot:CAMPEP_0179255526 /NCGR_PEP_ID=MMETSP0797-20121207/23794_1 /TAXON_ID=47934 /ORGANISM="Dinophysis acuminata, Strain DAEP01" /LENGTH=63 /DNA_ID=CAMNT_0020963427 /DNA_START=82 /DNA_END=270 /DNA_ORIENTATION=+
MIRRVHPCGDRLGDEALAFVVVRLRAATLVEVKALAASGGRGGGGGGRGALPAPGAASPPAAA